MTTPRTNAGHDQNFVTTLLGVSSSDGTAPTPVEVNPTTGAMLTEQTTSATARAMRLTQHTVITSSTSETTVFTAGATGIFNDIYGVIVTNTSASASEVTFKDATSGTTRFIIYAPAGDTRGFMLPTGSAHNQAVAANNWTATCGTSVASIKITMLAISA